jgi:hypothetical protein
VRAKLSSAPSSAGCGVGHGGAAGARGGAGAQGRQAAGRRFGHRRFGAGLRGQARLAAGRGWGCRVARSTRAFLKPAVAALGAAHRAPFHPDGAVGNGIASAAGGAGDDHSASFARPGPAAQGHRRAEGAIVGIFPPLAFRPREAGL